MNGKIEVQLQPGALHTFEDESNLVKSVQTIDNEVEHTTVTEYRLKSDPDNPRPVHRSVHVQMKRRLISNGFTGQLNLGA